VSSRQPAVIGGRAAAPRASAAKPDRRCVGGSAMRRDRRCVGGSAARRGTDAAGLVPPTSRENHRLAGLPGRCAPPLGCCRAPAKRQMRRSPRYRGRNPAPAARRGRANDGSVTVEQIRTDRELVLITPPPCQRPGAEKIIRVTWTKPQRKLGRVDWCLSVAAERPSLSFLLPEVTGALSRPGRAGGGGRDLRVRDRETGPCDP